MSHSVCDYSDLTVYDVRLPTTACIDKEDLIILAEGGIPTFDKKIPAVFLTFVESKKLPIINPLSVEFSDVFNVFDITPSVTPTTYETLAESCTWNWVVIALIVAEAFARFGQVDRSDEAKAHAINLINEVMDTRGGCYAFEMHNEDPASCRVFGECVLLSISNIFIQSVDGWDEGMLKIDTNVLQLVTVFFRRQMTGGLTALFIEHLQPVIRDLFKCAINFPPNVRSASRFNAEDTNYWKVIREIIEPDMILTEGGSTDFFSCRPTIGRTARHGHKLFVSLVVALCSRIGIAHFNQSTQCTSAHVIPDEARKSQIRKNVSVIFKMLVSCEASIDSKGNSVRVMSFVDDVAFDGPCDVDDDYGDENAETKHDNNFIASDDDLADIYSDCEDKKQVNKKKRRGRTADEQPRRKLRRLKKIKMSPVDSPSSSDKENDAYSDDEALFAADVDKEDNADPLLEFVDNEVHDDECGSDDDELFGVDAEDSFIDLFDNNSDIGDLFDDDGISDDDLFA